MSSVAQKLGLKPGNSVAIDGVAIADARVLLGELPDGVTVAARGASQVDQLILVAQGLADLATMLPGTWSEIAPNGRLWVWYRKGAGRSKTESGDVPLHRDTLQALLAEHGMVGVTLISVDETWSSMRVKRT